MIEIKTITSHTEEYFDDTVNAALKGGWELVRRECFITGADRATTFYAELERLIDEPENEEEDEDDGIVAEWEIARDPSYPFRCSACGCKSHKPIKHCPNCNRIMIGAEE